MLIIVVILLIVVVILFMPLALIWALNTLFALGIAYTFWTWLAMLVVAGAIGGTAASSKQS